MTVHTLQNFLWRTLAAGMAMAILAPAVQAQVPADIAAKLREIGQVVDPPGTAPLYRPLQPRQPYAGVTVLRDQSYGYHARHILDVFAPAGEAAGPTRPVLIYVAGGGGNKIEQVPDGDAFYDNIMLWAVKNGMVGVNVQRLGGGGRAWDDPARDIGMVISWVNANIGKYQGNPQRVFVWAHSAGTGPTSAYITQAQAHPPTIGVGLKGAILMGGNINIAPVVVNAAPGRGGAAAAARGAGAAPAGAPAAGVGGAAAAPAAGAPAGAQAGAQAGAAGGRAGGGGGRGGQDPAVQLARSNLPGFKSTPVALFFGAGSIDTPGAVAFVNTARTEICRAKANCQAVIFQDHSHMSSVFSPNTADNSVTGPILKWMQSVR